MKRRKAPKRGCYSVNPHATPAGFCVEGRRWFVAVERRDLRPVSSALLRAFGGKAPRVRP